MPSWKHYQSMYILRSSVCLKGLFVSNKRKTTEPIRPREKNLSPKIFDFPKILKIQEINVIREICFRVFLKRKC